MDRLNDNQREYIQKIFDEMKKKLYNYALRYLKNDNLAKDAIQETFLTICEKPDELMQSSSPQGYVFNTLKNKIRDEIKEIIKANERFVQQIHSDEENVEPIESQIPDDRSYFVDAEYSDAVKEEDYKIIKLVDMYGYTISEAAKTLGIDTETCKKRVQRARKRMKNAIK